MFNDLMGLNLKFRREWINKLPLEIQKLIWLKAKEAFYDNLIILQDVLIELNERDTPQFKLVQYGGPITQNKYFPPIKLVKIEWDILNGMLLLLGIVNDDVPEFFGPKLRGPIQSYDKGDSFGTYIISEIPRFQGNNYLPATNHILLSGSKPHWVYYGDPYNFTKIDKKQTYSEYFVNFKGPDDVGNFLEKHS